MIPGLFSGQIYIVDVSDPMRPSVETVREDLTKRSGYTVPHTVIGLENGNNLVSMIGANSETTAPGGLVEIDGKTGKFVRTFGPRSNRDWNKEPPKYMYDMGIKPEPNRMVTTSFGLPKHVAPAITIDGLGTDAYVWDYKARKVIQKVRLGKGHGGIGGALAT